MRVTIVPEDPVRISSPESSESGVLSFLSSHHSDDLSLLELETYPMRVPSPSWPSDSSPSPELSLRSSSVSVRPRSSLAYSSDVSEPVPEAFPAPMP